MLIGFNAIFQSLRIKVNHRHLNTISPKVTFALTLILIYATLVVARVWLRPYFPITHDLLSDWYNHVAYFPVFVLGYMLAVRSSQVQSTLSHTIWWQFIIERRWTSLWVGCLGYTFIFADRHGHTAWLAPLTLSPGFEALVIHLLTVSGCLLGYETIKRQTMLRLLFGLPVNSKKVLSKELQVDSLSQ